MPLNCPGKGLMVYEVPILFPSANPESAFTAITTKFIPGSLIEGEQNNLNVANLAKIEVCHHATGLNNFRVGIDYKNSDGGKVDTELLRAIYSCIKMVGESFNVSTQIVLISVPLESPLFDTLSELEAENRHQEQDPDAAEETQSSDES